MIVTSKPAFVLAFLVAVLCFSLAEASPGHGRPRKTTTLESPTPCTSSVSSTSCTPSATQTKPATLTFAQFPTGSPGDGYDLVFSSDWLYVACSVYMSNSCSDTCHPPCCNKGLCGTSTSTNLLIDYPSTTPPNFSITPRSPATDFTIFDITFTASDFQQYQSITVEITGTSITPNNPLPVGTVIIPKPASGQYYSSVTVNLVSLGLGAVTKLNFLAFYTAITAPGGGIQYAEVRLDSDGLGGGIKFEAYTPLGCENVYHRRDDMSISPFVVIKRELGGNEFAL